MLIENRKDVGNDDMINGKLKKLTKSEEELMKLFWEAEEPLTSVEILEMSADRSWNGNYVHVMLRSLLKKGMIRECGTVKYGKQYARRFTPELTKEQYAARSVMSMEIGLERGSIAAVAVAMVNEAGKEDETEEDVIKQLEEIIEELKNKDIKEK